MKHKFMKGEWVVNNEHAYGKVYWHKIECNNKTIAEVKGRHYKVNNKVCDANAKLIADAGTTASKCGLLPSELLEQRNELLEALEYLLNEYQETLIFEYSHSGEDNPEVIQAKQAIKKATE